MSEKKVQSHNVAGIYTNSNNKKYILFTLKLMRDAAPIFDKLAWGPKLKNIKKIEKFDVVIADSEEAIPEEAKKSLHP